MEILTMILFLVLTLGFGYSVTFFIRWGARWYEKFFLMIGFGLGVIPVLGVILNILRLQIYWPVFLVLSLLVPLYSLYKGRFSDSLERMMRYRFSTKVQKSSFFFIIALLMSAVFFGVYHHGAFTYPYLEDDDPWLHAEGVKYVKEMNTIDVPASVSKGFGKYLEPYPPGYDILMGILHQTNEDVIWTLKFFNVLILSLIGMLFYFFGITFLGSRKKALAATFFLIMIPCFMSHFIWASSLAVMLFFPSLYAVERIQEDRRWVLPAVLAMAGMIMTQMSNPFIFGIMLGVYLVVRSLSKRRFLWNVFLSGLVAVIVAFSLFWIPTVVEFGLDGTAAKNSVNLDDLGSITTKASGGGLVYSWGDFIIAKTASKMDNPIGIGIFLFFLLVFSLLLLIYGWVKQPKKIFAVSDDWKLISVLWLLIAFLGIHGNRLPFPMLMPHRWWAIFAIPVCLLSVEGFFALGSFFRRIRVSRLVVYAVIILGILATSGYPKYVVETSFWPPGVKWSSMDELKGYMSFVDPLPYNTKVFPVCSDEFKVLAFDKLAEPWDPSYVEFKASAFGKSPQEIGGWMRSKGYEYLTVDTSCLKDHSANDTDDFLLEVGNSKEFYLANSNRGFFLLRRT